MAVDLFSTRLLPIAKFQVSASSSLSTGKLFDSIICMSPHPYSLEHLLKWPLLFRRNHYVKGPLIAQCSQRYQ